METVTVANSYRSNLHILDKRNQSSVLIGMEKMKDVLRPATLTFYFLFLYNDLMLKYYLTAKFSSRQLAKFGVNIRAILLILFPVHVYFRLAYFFCLIAIAIVVLLKSCNIWCDFL